VPGRAYLSIALLVARNTPLRRLTRTIVFVPVVIGLAVSSLRWYWLFNYDIGLVNRLLVDLGVVSRPVIWFGEDADRALWAVIASIVWKALGFGMLLFVAAIQAIPDDFIEAAKIDGARYWQGVRMIRLPLTCKTILPVTLVSTIGSLLYRHGATRRRASPLVSKRASAIHSEPRAAPFPFGRMVQNEMRVARLNLNRHFIDQIARSIDTAAH
jgi:ABC-type polysaccharide transport system permease subunit